MMEGEIDNYGRQIEAAGILCGLENCGQSASKQSHQVPRIGSGPPRALARNRLSYDDRS